MNVDQETSSKVDLLMVSVDTPFHAMVPNFLLVMGADGCSWCEKSGKRNKKTVKVIQVYKCKQAMKKSLKLSKLPCSLRFQNKCPSR
jgi:hypothetical protein